MAHPYSVTIMNDASLSDGQGAVHTWLMTNSPGRPSQYFSFSNPPGTAGVFIGIDALGVSSVDENLKKRLPTEKITLGITKQQYDELTKQFNDFYKSNPTYDLTPDNEGDYNCVTASRTILQIAGIYYLDNIQTPFGVKYKINNGTSSHLIENMLGAKDDIDASAKELIRCFEYLRLRGFDPKDMVTRILFDQHQPITIPYGSQNAGYADYFLNVGGGLSALHEAARFDHLAILQFNVENKGESVSVKNANDNTPLHFAARYGRLDNVKYLINKNADFNALNQVKMTPLHFAALGGHLETAEYLVNVYRSRTIDFNVADGIHGATPLHYAASSGNLQLVQFLIDNGANVNERYSSGNTPLFYAVSKGGNLQIVRHLLQNGAIVSIQSDGTPILHFAALGGHIDIFRYLIENQQCQLDTRSNNIHTLQYAVRGGSLPIVQYIVDTKGIGINMVDIYDDTLLHDAACRGYVDIVRYLLKKGANQNARNKGNKTALDCARNKHHSNVVDCLNDIDNCISQRHRRYIVTKRAYPNDFLPSQGLNSNYLLNDVPVSAINNNQLKHEITNISVDAWHGSSTALLADLFVRKLTGEKYPLRSISSEAERKAEHLNEAEDRFEKAMQKKFIH